MLLHWPDMNQLFNPRMKSCKPSTTPPSCASLCATIAKTRGKSFCSCSTLLPLCAAAAAVAAAVLATLLCCRYHRNCRRRTTAATATDTTAAAAAAAAAAVANTAPETLEL